MIRIYFFRLGVNRKLVIILLSTFRDLFLNGYQVPATINSGPNNISNLLDFSHFSQNSPVSWMLLVSLDRGLYSLAIYRSCTFLICMIKQCWSMFQELINPTHFNIGWRCKTIPLPTASTWLIDSTPHLSTLHNPSKNICRNILNIIF